MGFAMHGVRLAEGKTLTPVLSLRERRSEKLGLPLPA
jgi:hypothetical protein